jgi:hypothetical protein
MSLHRFIASSLLLPSIGKRGEEIEIFKNPSNPGVLIYLTTHTNFRSEIGEKSPQRMG